jgi:hypothetical protein
MRLFHCQKKMDVANGSVEIFLELLALGHFPTDEPFSARSENGGENRACADDEGADDLWIHGLLMVVTLVFLKWWIMGNRHAWASGWACGLCVTLIKHGFLRRGVPQPGSR